MRKPPFRGRGFRAAGALVEAQVRRTGEGRGFAVARLLTRWPEIVGEEAARMCRPVKVTRGRGRLGGTLVLAVPGAAAPLLQMRAEAIRGAVNAATGYPAIGRVRLVQGRAEDFSPARAPAPAPAADTPLAAAASGAADPDLRDALAELARAVAARDTRRSPP